MLRAMLRPKPLFQSPPPVWGATTPTGKTVYVELKTEIGRLAKVQKWQRGELEKRGADVRVLYGMDAVKEFLREVFGDAVHTA